MTRILIVAAAALLVLGGVSTAFSPAGDIDPGPAIVLDKDPGGDTVSSQGADSADDPKHSSPGGYTKAGQGADGADDASYDEQSARVRKDDTTGGATFTVAHPKPVNAADEQDDDRDDQSDEEPDDEPNEEPDNDPGDD